VDTRQTCCVYGATSLESILNSPLPESYASVWAIWEVTEVVVLQTSQQKRTAIEEVLIWEHPQLKKMGF
jgi:hypothetical protein